jgi:hypothetical protein
VSLDYRAIRLRTRRQQGLGDDLPVDIVDDVVRIARSRTDSTSSPRRSIAAHPTSTSGAVLDVSRAAYSDEVASYVRN